MVTVFPRHGNARTISPTSTSTVIFSSVSASTSTTIQSISTSSMTGVMEDSNSARLTKNIIALLVVLGVLVIAVLAGFILYFRSRRRKYLSARLPSDHMTSLYLSSIGVSNAPTLVPTGMAAGSPEPTQTTSFDTRKQERSPEPAHEQERGRSPSIQYEISQSPRETSTKAEDPSTYRLVGHPYQAVSQEQPSPSASTTQVDSPSELKKRMRPAALVLPVNSFAAGSGPLSSSRISPPVFQRSLSTPPYVKTDSTRRRPGGTAASFNRPGRTARPPPVSMKSPTVVPPERRLSKSFLVFDDSDSPFPTPNAISHPSPHSTLSPTAVNPKLNFSKEGVVDSTVRLMAAAAPHTPALHDELPLKVGDVVKVLREYDDGWCIAETTEAENVAIGAIPKICLREQT